MFDINYAAQVGAVTPPSFNGTLAASVASNALTIALKTLSGGDPSPTDPVSIQFPDVTPATGDLTSLSVTAATSLVISSGSLMGFLNATPSRLWIVAFNDAGTVRLGAVNIRSAGLTSIMALHEGQLLSSTAEGGAGGADSAQVIYTGTAVTTKAFRILGYMEWSAGLTTAGTWAIVPTKIRLMTPGTPRPGDVVQTQYATTASPSSTTAATYQNSNLSVAITLSAEMNAVECIASAAVDINVATGGGFTRLHRGSTPIGSNGVGFQSNEVAGGSLITTQTNYAFDFPGSIASQTYMQKIAVGSAGTETVTHCALSVPGTIVARELMA